MVLCVCQGLNLCSALSCAIEKPRVLQSTYIRTYRVGGGRRRGVNPVEIMIVLARNRCITL